MNQTAQFMKSYLKQHDYLYERAPMDWHHGIPLSNGRLAAMLWGDGKPFILTLDRYDLWDLRQKPIDWSTYNYANMKKLQEEAHRTGDGSKVYEAFGRDFETDWYHKAVKQTRLLPGRVEIELAGQTLDYEMRLDLYAAQSVGKIKTTKGNANLRCFIDGERDVIVADVEAKAGERIKRIDSRATKADFGHLGYPPAETGKTGKINWRLQKQYEGGGEYTVAWTIVKSPDASKGIDKQTLYCTIAFSRTQGSTVAEAVGKIKEAVKLGSANLFKEHSKYWANYWQKSFITIPDPQIENLYYAQLYLLACNSREGAGFGQGCLGIWCPDDVMPGWANQHCYDMNYQMDTWMTFPSNHVEKSMPMAEDLWRWHPGRREFCQRFYGCDGATLNSGVDFDGWNVPGWYCADLWPGCGPWACQTLWNIYLYAKDKDFLRDRAYPMMKDYIGQYVGMLEKWDDGKFHIPWSPSPEWQNNEAFAWGQDDSGNLALVRWLGSALLEAENVLGIESAESAKWIEILDNLAPFHQDQTGLLIMKNKPLSQTHRHHTHLLALYPLGIINIESSDEDRKLIERCLGNIVMRGMGAWCGYSIAWMSAIGARVGKSKRAHELLKLFANIATVENAIHSNADTYQKGFMHSGVVILTPEGGFAAAAALLEMLIQSWNGIIRIFPSMPPQWAEAAFDNLRAEGAFLVSGRRTGGKATWVKIESEAGGTCKVRNPFGGAAKIFDETTGTQRKVTGDEFAFETKPGEVFVLTPWEAKKASDARPEFNRTAGNTNWYGLKEIPRF